MDIARVEKRASVDQEAVCLAQSKTLIDKSLAAMGVGWGKLVLPQKESIYEDFTTAIALDKYRNCMKQVPVR